MMADKHTPRRQGVMAVWVIALSAVLCVAVGGCGGKKASPKADAAELERAFVLQAGATPADSQTPAGLAAGAVAAIKTQDWVKAVGFLDQLRRIRGLTADQMQAVHNAGANAYVRLVELANQGSTEAKAVLDRSKREADRR